MFDTFRLVYYCLLLNVLGPVSREILISHPLLVFVLDLGRGPKCFEAQPSKTKPNCTHQVKKLGFILFTGQVLGVQGVPIIKALNELQALINDKLVLGTREIRINSLVTSCDLYKCMKARDMVKFSINQRSARLGPQQLQFGLVRET